MNVAVNAIPLTNIQTGIGRYLRCLYMEIARSYPEIDLRFFDGRRLLDRMPCSPGERGLWSARTLAMWAMPEQLVAAGRTARLALREKRLQRFVAGCDMYHDSYLFPFDCGGRVATVFTLHDLSLVRHPELHPPERVRFFNAHFAQRLQKVRYIIVPSEFTRQEAVTLLGVNPERIVVIPEGYDRDLFKICSALQVAVIKQKYGL
ncbi:MAG: glycosyltransferase family 4 protein, partial [Deltaproteobacteria bacterium]|nr:glycosyltransferase family 4 protein [Deltaproteobacteria bacterium]